MCQVCKCDYESPEEVLKAVEQAVKKGADPEHFKALIDRALGTEMEERDEKREEKWEANYRRTRHPTGFPSGDLE